MTYSSLLENIKKVEVTINNRYSPTNVRGMVHDFVTIRQVGDAKPTYRYRYFQSWYQVPYSSSFPTHPLAFCKHSAIQCIRLVEIFF